MEYFYYQKGKQMGPHDVSGMLDALESQKITEACIVWRDGLDQPIPFSSCKELMEAAAEKKAKLKKELEAAAVRSKIAEKKTGSHASSVYIGIDFGTTKTMASKYDTSSQQPRPLRLGRGTDESPTAIYIPKNGEHLFGEDADDEGLTDSLNYATRFKMKLGHKGFAHVGASPASALDLSSLFLDHVRKHIETQSIHEKITSTVLTVPAIFGPAQRKELEDAAKGAGYQKIALLEEPVAAALAYCSINKDVSRSKSFMVVDWGGGTLDIAVVKHDEDGLMSVVDGLVTGLDDLGGEVFDDELWNVVTNSLVGAGYPNLESQPPEYWGRYRRELRKGKERLSSVSTVKLSFVFEDATSARVEACREDFEAVIVPHVKKAAKLVDELCQKSKGEGVDVDFILLVGGTSRIPLVEKIIGEMVGLECRRWDLGREAIALGASVRAHELWGSMPQSIDKALAVKKYREMLERAYADEEISGKEHEILIRLKSELGLTAENVEALECEVMGSNLECVFRGWNTKTALGKPSPLSSKPSKVGGESQLTQAIGEKSVRNESKSETLKSNVIKLIKRGKAKDAMYKAEEDLCVNPSVQAFDDWCAAINAVGADSLVFRSVEYIAETRNTVDSWSIAASMYYYENFKADTPPPEKLSKLVNVVSPFENLDYPDLVSRHMWLNSYWNEKGDPGDLNLVIKQKYPDSAYVILSLSFASTWDNLEMNSAEDFIREYKTGVMNKHFKIMAQICPVTELIVKMFLGINMYMLADPEQDIPSLVLEELKNEINKCSQDLKLLAPNSLFSTYGSIIAEYSKKDLELATSAYNQQVASFKNLPEWGVLLGELITNAFDGWSFNPEFVNNYRSFLTARKNEEETAIKLIDFLVNIEDDTNALEELKEAIEKWSANEDIVERFLIQYARAYNGSSSRNDADILKFNLELCKKHRGFIDGLVDTAELFFCLKSQLEAIQEYGSRFFSGRTMHFFPSVPEGKLKQHMDSLQVQISFMENMGTPSKAHADMQNSEWSLPAIIIDDAIREPFLFLHPKLIWWDGEIITEWINEEISSQIQKATKKCILKIGEKTLAVTGLDAPVKEIAAGLCLYQKRVKERSL